MGGLCCLQHGDEPPPPTVVFAEMSVRPARLGGATGSSGRRLIFQLGAGSWCTPEEPASASGRLHEAHHLAFEAMQDAACYSVYPSAVHDESPGAAHVCVVRQPQIPCYKSAPGSGDKCWHAMSNKEVEDYLQRLEEAVCRTMKRAEEEQDCDVTLAIAYHAFLGPLVLRRAIRRRVAAGLKPTPIAAVCEGEELCMYSSERSRKAPGCSRFKAMLDREWVFTNLETGVQAVVLPSEQTKKQFAEHFPDFPTDRTFISLFGYSPAMFYPQRTSLAEVVCRCLRDVEPGDPMQLCVSPLGLRRLVLFVAGDAHAGAAVRAAGFYELTFQDVLTVILFDTALPEPDVGVASLRRTCLGVARSYADLAGLYSAADVCVFLSAPEPSGRPLVECMACGTPVIGITPGVAMSLITDKVGALISRSPDVESFADDLRVKVCAAVSEDWKAQKGPACLELCRGFSAERQCSEMVRNIADMVEEQRA